MAIDFPNSPALNQVFNAPTGASYQWNGTVWLPVGASGSLTTSDTPPTSPGPGQLWWNSALGQLMIWFNDGSSSQWVVASPVPMLGGGTGDFQATYVGASSSIVSGPATTAVFNTVVGGNAGGWYNVANGRYTPPAGRYRISAVMNVAMGSTATVVQIFLRKNGVNINSSVVVLPVATEAPLPIELEADANGSDFFDLVIGSNAAGATFSGAQNRCSFSAFPLTGMQGPIGPSGPSSGLQQTVFFETGAVATGTTVIPFDDTIPQISEGNEYMTCSITPRSATSRLIIEVMANVVSSVSTVQIVGALFQDSTANALAASWVFAASANTGGPLNFIHVMTSGTTSSTTFRFRAGGNAASTTTFNGQSGSRALGGVMASSIVIQEVLP